MAAANGQMPLQAAGHHQRTKSSVLRSFMMHRCNDSNGDGLAAAPLMGQPAASPEKAAAGLGRGQNRPLEEVSHNLQQEPLSAPSSLLLQTGKHAMSSNNSANSLSNGSCPVDATSSPTKKKKLTRGAPLTIVAETLDTGNADSSIQPPPLSPIKKARTRSATNLVGLLSRPKSLKNLHKASKEMEEDSEDEERGRSRGKIYTKKRDKSRHNKDGKDKENRTPPSSMANAAPPQVTPIYAQFCSTSSANSNGSMVSGNHTPSATAMPPNAASGLAVRPSFDKLDLSGSHHEAKPRPKSFHPGSSSVSNSSTSTTGPQLMIAFSSTRQRQYLHIDDSSTPTTPVDSSGLMIDPKDIDTHLEALLDRRNIPEHQRYKMRNLASTIKLEFIRQDWAEERTKRQQSERPHSHDSVLSASGTSETPVFPTPTTTPNHTGTEGSSSAKATKSKHSRVKSLTLSKVTRGRSQERDNSNSDRRHKSPGSPLKKKMEGTLGRHLRSKSTESFVNASSGQQSDASGAASTAVAASGSGNGISGFFSKAKTPQHTPGDFVTYLRTVQTPEKVEVGKLHKLRLLLRNETVAWTEDFIGQGGMEEVVSLLHRILAVEWREEHEDALLHENLLCLKALCTTALALQYLHSIHARLLPALIHMIFDPEKKGPSEFTTRNIVTWVLFTYIQCAPAHERSSRAKTVLGYLRDPEGEEGERPVSFVLEMRKDRPYRVWCKEVVSVTKEVFWIFLHHLNVVSLPAAAKEKLLPPADEVDNGTPTNGGGYQSCTDRASPPSPPQHGQPSSYMLRHFPQERPPVPAAPYVGGVEWEATNYLASHLDLVNAILACTPTAAERNHLRSQMQMSGWERCMGSSLRLCKEKFYGAVHDGLRTWVAAAYDDGWNVRDVRYGPPPPLATTSGERGNKSSKKGTPAVGGPKADEPAPKLEIPELDFVLDG